MLIFGDVRKWDTVHTDKRNCMPTSKFTSGPAVSVADRTGDQMSPENEFEKWKVAVEVVRRLRAAGFDCELHRQSDLDH